MYDKQNKSLELVPFSLQIVLTHSMVFSTFIVFIT